MAEPIMKRVKGDGLEIQLAVWEGAGDPVFCVHGTSATCRCWDVLARLLSPEYTVIAMDLRGRGLSDQPPSGYGVDHHCRDISRALDELGLKRAVLMGHALGGLIVMAFAASRPEAASKIVLFDYGAKLTQEQRARLLAALKPTMARLGRVYPSFAAYRDEIEKSLGLAGWSPALESRYRYELEEVEGGLRPRVRPETVAEEGENLAKVDIASLYAKITCPTLILRATKGMGSPDDLFLPPEALARMLAEIPRVKYLDLNGADHFSIMFMDHPERDRAILSFLRE